MGRLARTDGLTDVQQEILATVRDFVEREIIPVASELEHADEYPTEIVDGMREMGLFGLTIPEEYGGLGESLLTYALVVEELARGWMSVSGIINTHFIVAYMLLQHGTDEQKQSLPAADGDRRGARRVLDVRARLRLRRRRRSRTKAVRDGDDYVIDGQKMWLTNGGFGQPGRGAGQDRRGRRVGLPEHDHVAGGEAEPASARSRPGSPCPARSRRWATRASTPPSCSSTATACRPSGPRRRARARLLPDDGRRRGRPGQRGRPRLRRRAARLRARSRGTRSSARRSASRSPSTRPCCSGWPTWPPRSRRRTR